MRSGSRNRTYDAEDQNLVGHASRPSRNACAREDLNLRPVPYQRTAPTRLSYTRANFTNVDQVGVEPTTSPVQGERATRCATSPRPRPAATGGTAYCERVAGLEPVPPVWKTGVQPETLHSRDAARLRPGSNRRPSARQADALPLSYEAKNVVRALGRSRTCTRRRRKPPPSPLGHEGRSCGASVIDGS